MGNNVGSEMERLPSNAAARGRPKKDAGAPPSPEQLRRLRFIERAALWTGRVGRRAVAVTFDLSASHVSLDFRRYQTMAPKNLGYDVAAQCYRPTENFRPIFEGGDTADVLMTIAATATLHSQEQGRLLGFELPAAVIQPLPMVIDQGTLAVVLRGITAGTIIEISYQSLSTPVPVVRRFSPHALIFTGYRWLMRGWDERHDAYRDLALARIMHAIEAQSTAGTLSRDDLWHDRVTLKLAPSPEFSSSQASVIAREYGMRREGKGWVVGLSTRKALVPYVLDYLRLRPGEGQSEIATVRLNNYPAIASFDRRRTAAGS